MEIKKISQKCLKPQDLKINAKKLSLQIFINLPKENILLEW